MTAPRTCIRPERVKAIEWARRMIAADEAEQ